MIFENYSRSEAALVAGMAEMVVNGVSTRKVSRVMEELCGTSFSKPTVSDVCKDLDKSVHEFRTRPLDGEYPFLTVDATYFKVRQNSRIISKAFMIAYGTNAQGHREILGFGVYQNESSATWTDFLMGLKKRGLTRPSYDYIRRRTWLRRSTKPVSGRSYRRCSTAKALQWLARFEIES